MKAYSSFRIFILILASVAGAGAVNVSGKIVDARSGESIVAANVFIPGSDYGAATDLNGFFVIRKVPAGACTLRISHIAYAGRDLTLSVKNSDLYLDRIELEPAAYQGQQVEVTAQRNELVEKDVDIGSFQADPVVLQEIPQLNKDVFRLVRFSPGVTTANAFSPQYFVRGSDAGENMVLLDGMTIYNPQHFMGSAAVFNPYAIKNMEMLAGGFGAEYGGRNASILLISTREGHQDEIHGEFRPGISGMTGAIEFPINRQVTAMVSGRMLTDLSFAVLMGSPNLLSDFNTAILWRSPRQQTRLSAFYARDYMDYSIDNLLLFLPQSAFEKLEEGFITDTRNHAIGLKNRLVITPSLLLETHLYRSGSQVDNRTVFSYLVEDTTSAMNFGLDSRSRIENGILDYTWKNDLIWYLPFAHTLQTGFEVKTLRFSNEMGRFQGKSSPDIYTADNQAAYLQDKMIWKGLTLKTGLRVGRSGPGQPWLGEPRLSAAVDLKAFTLKAGYGRYVQYLTTLDSKNDEFVQFLDYYNSLKDLAPLSSTQGAVSVEKNLTPELFASLTAYSKNFARLYRSSYSNDFSVNRGIVLEKGEGEAYGIEVLLRIEKARLSGWISYAYSRGLRRYPGILGGRTHIFDGDQPHNFKSVLSYKLTRDITASTTFEFSSGFPRTWETGMFLRYDYDPAANQLNAFSASLTPEINNVRYPPHINWEIGWKKKLRSGFGYQLAEYLGLDEAYFTTSIRNLLFLYRNPQYYFYIPEFGYYALGTSYLPSVSAGYSLVF